MNRLRIEQVVAVAVVLMLASCGSGGNPAATPKVTTTTHATTTTTSRSVETKRVAPTVQIGVESMNDSFMWRPGDCLTWMQGGMATTSLQHVVPCSQAHLVEIAGGIRVPPHYVHYPTDAQWRALAQHDCLLLVDTLLGGPVEPDSGYYATALTPLPTYWAQEHDRVAQCAVAKWGATPPDIERELSPFVGSVEGTARSRLEHVGACEDADFIYTACTNPHRSELSGYVDLTGVSKRPANDDEWKPFGSRCEQVGRTYLGHDYRADGLYAYIEITPERWAAGTRVMECFVDRADASGHVVNGTGSLRDG